MSARVHPAWADAKDRRACEFPATSPGARRAPWISQVVTFRREVSSRVRPERDSNLQPTRFAPGCRAVPCPIVAVLHLVVATIASIVGATILLHVYVS